MDAGLRRRVLAIDGQDVAGRERAGTVQHINLFKNSLIYTLTYTIVNDYISSGRGSVLTLALSIAVCVFICHYLQIELDERTDEVSEAGGSVPRGKLEHPPPHFALPLYALLAECMDTAKNMLVQLEATLIARYAQIILVDAHSHIWIFILSSVGISLWWILMVSLGLASPRVKLV